MKFTIMQSILSKIFPVKKKKLDRKDKIKQCIEEMIQDGKLIKETFTDTENNTITVYRKAKK